MNIYPNQKRKNEKETAVNTRVIWHSIPRIGYFARTATKGEEYDMVIRFVNVIKQKYDSLKTKSAMIFVEPQIESGYPDIVIVEYRNWQQSEMICRNRRQLNQTDLKILMQMQLSGYASVSKISEILGFDEKTVIRSSETLADTGLLYFSKQTGSMRKVSLKKWCPISRIISIEAKLDRWSEAISQADLNRWFATDSYVLLNKRSCSDNIANKCTQLGIGVLLDSGTINNPISSSHNHYPVSYASLQFYEWLQRLLMEENKL